MVMHHERVGSMSSTKKHEQELRMVYEPYHTRHSCKQVAKRSYRRACNRAKQYGFTWYRGGQPSGQDNAVPALGQSASPSPANGGLGDSHCGDLQEHLQHSEVDGRQQCDAEVSRLEEDTGGGQASTAYPLALDFEPSQQPGASAEISRIVASRLLAAHSSEIEAFGPTTIGGAISKDSLRFGVVRLFLNPSGKAGAANSVVACLVWMMLLVGGFVYEKWRCLCRADTDDFGNCGRGILNYLYIVKSDAACSLVTWLALALHWTGLFCISFDFMPLVCISCGRSGTPAAGIMNFCAALLAAAGGVPLELGAAD